MFYKKHPDGTIKEYIRTRADGLVAPQEWEEEDGQQIVGDEWITPLHNSESWRSEAFIRCGCDSESFKVSWWDYPFTGGYCKIVCSRCGAEAVLIDDYA